MVDKLNQQHATEGNMEKDPADWVTGDEPMTGAQRSYLKTLSEEAHEPFDDTLTKAAASLRIDELQARTGHGSKTNAEEAGSTETGRAATTPAGASDARRQRAGHEDRSGDMGGIPKTMESGAASSGLGHDGAEADMTSDASEDRTRREDSGV